MLEVGGAAPEIGIFISQLISFPAKYFADNSYYLRFAFASLDVREIVSLYLLRPSTKGTR